MALKHHFIQKIAELKEVCRQEKKQIEKEIKDKVAELEKSELSNTEKQEKINKLLTEHSEELETVDKLLEDERTQYRSIRDKLIERLCQPCSVCPEKERDKKHLRQKIIYSFMITGLLVGVEEREEKKSLPQAKVLQTEG
ncbi:21089_t:CDS:2 [Gigaspora margarita]|uniref:21089_t:CDS:1 n=1 Tax=Gigaspora margarita TaxID=4874 RepID=A0ABN7VRP1_GIGMA|nr:21089_t:CDS:2 [Gigaspora margarita]